MASAPASRTVSLRSAKSLSRVSGAGNGHALYADGGCVGAIAKFKIIRTRQVEEHVFEVPRNGDLTDGIGNLAILDPEAGSTPAVITRHAIHTHADEFGDVKPAPNIGDQFFHGQAARFHIEIGGGR